MSGAPERTREERERLVKMAQIASEDAARMATRSREGGAWDLGDDYELRARDWRTIAAILRASEARESAYECENCGQIMRVRPDREAGPACGWCWNVEGSNPDCPVHGSRRGAPADGESERIEGKWYGEPGNWIAPFHACPHCGSSLNWTTTYDVFDRDWIEATCCTVKFYAPLIHRGAPKSEEE